MYLSVSPYIQLYIHHHDQRTEQLHHLLISPCAVCWQPLSLLPNPRLVFCAYGSTPSRKPIHEILRHSAFWVLLPGLTHPSTSRVIFPKCKSAHFSVFKPRETLQGLASAHSSCLSGQTGWVALKPGLTTRGLVNTTHSWVLAPETEIQQVGRGPGICFFYTSLGRYGGRWSQATLGETQLSPKHLPFSTPAQAYLCGLLSFLLFSLTPPMYAVSPPAKGFGICFPIMKDAPLIPTHWSQPSSCSRQLPLCSIVTSTEKASPTPWVSHFPTVFVTCYFLFLCDSFLVYLFSESERAQERAGEG